MTPVTIHYFVDDLIVLFTELTVSMPCSHGEIERIRSAIDLRVVVFSSKFSADALTTDALPRGMLA
jgi:hypothetical protein